MEFFCFLIDNNYILVRDEVFYQIIDTLHDPQLCSYRNLIMRYVCMVDKTKSTSLDNVHVELTALYGPASVPVVRRYRASKSTPMYLRQKEIHLERYPRIHSLN